MTSRGWSWVGGLMVLAALPACDRGEGAAPKPSGGTSVTATAATGASSAAAARSSATASASAATSAAPAVPDQPRPPAAKIACKAVESGKRTVLGTRTDSIADIRAWGDRVYVFGYKKRSARTTIAFFTRDGADKGEVGKYEGLGEPKSFRLTADHGYFVQHGGLVGIPLAGGEAKVLSKGFAQVMTVYAGYAYGMRCAAKGKNDELVQVALTGGDGKVLATIERTTQTCKYGDIAVRGNTAFVTEWEGRRLLSVDLKSGKVMVLSEGHAFASTIFVRDEVVDFSTSVGLMRIPQAGGKATKLTEAGASPFAHLVEHGKDYWIFQGEPYHRNESIWRFPHDGKEAVKVFTFVVEDPTSGSGVYCVAADDQCYYYPLLTGDGSFSTILARPRKAKD